jgi:hypothetical protein
MQQASDRLRATGNLFRVEPMKHLPFQSIYRSDFEVVEDRHGKVRLFPHTGQLPVLHRALNLEFLGPLPGRIARVDRRADDLHKIQLRTAALLYASTVNASRPDALRGKDGPRNARGTGPAGAATGRNFSWFCDAGLNPVENAAFSRSSASPLAQNAPFFGQFHPRGRFFRRPFFPAGISGNFSDDLFSGAGNRTG